MLALLVLPSILDARIAKWKEKPIPVSISAQRLTRIEFPESLRSAFLSRSDIVVEKEDQSLYVRALAPDVQDALFVVGESGTIYEINLSTSDKPDQPLSSLISQITSGPDRAGAASACSGSHALDDARTTKGWLRAQRSQGTIGPLSFELRNLPAGTVIRTDEEAAYLLAPYWATNTHYFVLSGPQTLVIACESTNANRVLRSIYEDLKRGASQLSGTRPSILTCQLEDIDDEDWGQLQSESGLAAMSRRLLSGSDRRHVNFVVYSSTKTPPNRDGAYTSFSTTTLRFQNPNAEYSFPLTFLLAQRES